MARVHFNVSEVEFGRLTPAKWFWLWERWDEEQERQDIRAAQICALIANQNRPKGKKAAKPADFMPDHSKARPSKKKQKPRQSVEEQIALAKSITLAYGGRIGKQTK